MKESNTLCFQTDEEQVAAGVDMQQFFEGAPALLEVLMNQATSQVLNEVAAEREYQNKRWGTSFDDTNTPSQWMGYVSAYGARNLVGASAVDLEKFRVDMIKVAALAVAAVEAIDRKTAPAVVLKAVA